MTQPAEPTRPSTPPSSPRTPTSERLHIGIFGRRNAGKSSLINALTGQAVALVSNVPGTTTDPVSKPMEMAPIGPVVFIDTAGIDDEGVLGRMRVERTRRVLRRIDVAILVLDSQAAPGQPEDEVLADLRRRRIPVVAVLNKTDLLSGPEAGGTTVPFGAPAPAAEAHEAWAGRNSLSLLKVSALTGRGLGRLKQALVAAAPPDWSGPSLTENLAGPGDLVVLVVPVDLEAPKGRLILPQVETIRDLLDHGASALVTKENELGSVLAGLKRPPRLVITDSQAFGLVDEIVPREIPLTSFSILFARHKGDLETLVRGALAIDNLGPGDPVLVAEACTHHPIGDDIGRLKIPRWLEKRVGGLLDFEHYSGNDFPPDLERYKLIIHCGGCMINRGEMLHRLGEAEEAGIPITNYGTTIAHLHGILGRAVEPFNLTVEALPRPTRSLAND